MAEKENTVRKVFMLPADLVERISDYRHEQGLDSEVEAVRRLLDGALLNRDTVESLLTKFLMKFRHEKDLRVIARDVLATHPLVETITYGPDSVGFTVKSSGKAVVDKAGKSYLIGPDDKWAEMFLSRDNKLAPLDDDIPF